MTPDPHEMSSEYSAREMRLMHERDSALARAEQAEDGCANWHRIALEKQEQLTHSESERLRHLKAAQDATERAERAEREIARLTANADHSCTCPHGDAKEPLANHDKMCPIRVNKLKRIAPEVALSRLAAALDNSDEVDELRNEITQLRADLAAARDALRAAQTALYDAMHAGHLSRAYHDGVIAKIEAALYADGKP